MPLMLSILLAAKYYPSWCFWACLPILMWHQDNPLNCFFCLSTQTGLGTHASQTASSNVHSSEEQGTETGSWIPKLLELRIFSSWFGICQLPIILPLTRSRIPNRQPTTAETLRVRVFAFLILENFVIKNLAKTKISHTPN